MNIVTWGLVVLQSDYILGALLQTLEEVHNKVSDVLRIWTLEGEFLVSHGHKGKGLGECFAAPKRDDKSKNLTFC